MRTFWPTALAVAFLTVLAPAQSVQALEPAIEIRIRSVDDLMARFDYLTNLVGQEEAAKNVHNVLKALTADGKGVEGIDPKKPFGVYAAITPDVVDSTAVLMVPIADQERFLAMFKERLGVEPEKADDVLKVNLPLLNEPAYFRFTNDYLYVATRLAAIDAKAIIPAKTFFAKEESAAATAVVRFDRLPEELKKTAIAQFEMKLKEDHKKKEVDEGAGQKKLHLLVIDSIAGGVNAALQEGKELNIKLLVDAATDELSTEANLTAKPDSALARSIAALADRSSLPAGICAVENPVVRFSAKLEMKDGAKKEYGEAVDAILEDALKNANEGAKGPVERVFAAISPTLKAGLLDVSAAFSGPDSKGQYSLIAAVAIKDGKKIEKLFKDFGAFLGLIGGFTFDIEKVGPFTIHKLVLNNPDEKQEKLFGSRTIWLATSEDCLVASVEPEGDLLRSRLKAKPAAAPVLMIEGSAARLIPILHPTLKPDEVKALLADAFDGKAPTGKDTASITLTGGTSLKVNVKAKGKAVRLVTGLGKLKGE